MLSVVYSCTFIDLLLLLLHLTTGHSLSETLRKCLNGENCRFHSNGFYVNYATLSLVFRKALIRDKFGVNFRMVRTDIILLLFLSL